MPEVTILLKKICTYKKPEELTNEDLPLGNGMTIPKGGRHPLIGPICTFEGKELSDILFFCYAEEKGFLSLSSGDLFYPLTGQSNIGGFITTFGELDEVSFDINKDDQEGNIDMPVELKKGQYFQTDNQYWIVVDDIATKSLALVNISTGAIVRGGDLMGFLKQRQALLVTVTFKE